MALRIETGPVEFGDDWRGVYIRGDNALYYAMELKRFLANNKTDDWMAEGNLQSLLELLQSAAQGGDSEPVQKLKDFRECEIKD